MELFVDIQKKLPGFSLRISFTAGRDVMGLLGASGSGKSMTLRCIAGIERPDRGKIILNGRVLFDSEKGICVSSRQCRVGYLFQNYALFPHMTVEENVGFGIGKLPKEKRRAIVREKLEMMKLQELEKRLPFQLSGGQQQRVALARALAIEPEVLLLDEPFSALDDHLRGLLTRQLMDTLAEYHGVTLFVTHNMEEAYRVCGGLVALKNGSIEEAGSREELFQQPSSLATAQLTGCKNFSTAEYLSEHQLHAADWGIRLKVKKPLQAGLKYVGIRAHYIRQAAEDDEENVFVCWPGFISEAPFRVTVYLSVGSKPASSEAYHLQWEISKEEWLVLKEQPLPWSICLSPEKLMPFDR